MTGSLEIYSNRQLKELSLAELVFIEQDLKILDNGMLQGIDMPKFNGIDGEIKGYSMISTTPQFHGNAENFQVQTTCQVLCNWIFSQVSSQIWKHVELFTVLIMYAHLMANFLCFTFSSVWFSEYLSRCPCLRCGEEIGKRRSGSII